MDEEIIYILLMRVWYVHAIVDQNFVIVTVDCKALVFMVYKIISGTSN